MKFIPKIKAPVSLLLLILLFSAIGFKAVSSVSYIQQQKIAFQQKSENLKSDNQLPCEESENDSEDERDGEKEADDLFKDFVISFLCYHTSHNIVLQPEGSNHFIASSILEAGQSQVPVFLSNRSIRV
jgi:hypothetical protein